MANNNGTRKNNVKVNNSVSANSAAPAASGGKRKSRKSAGKRKLSGYMKFAMGERKKLPKTMKFTQQGKELGKRWRALSDAEKKKY
jgi:hypothetical protein